MHGTAELLFWASVLLVGYTYLGYPALIYAWARLRPPPTPSAPGEPAVTMLVVAYNEAARMRERLANLAALDYPRARLQILVASDGSTDGTAEQARTWAGAGVEVVSFATRRGKPAVVNDVMRRARGEIVVLADARQRFAADALCALVAPFADPRVGAVSGELILAGDREAGAVGEGVGLYWRYEKLIRRSESRVDSTVGATGAIYAIRRSLFEPILDDTILDDVLIPLRIARRGYRVLFDPGARAYDRVAATAREEFARKVRTLAGNFQLLARERWLLDPLRNRLWLQTVSHKALRLLTPLLLLTTFAADLFLVGSRFHRWTLAGQFAFYAAAVGGRALRGARPRIRILTVPYVVCLLSLATVIAFYRFLTGRQPVTWEKALPSRVG